MSPDLDRFLSISDVLRIVPLSRTSIWRLERRGEFPRRIHVGLRRIGWRASEVRRWIDERT